MGGGGEESNNSILEDNVISAQQLYLSPLCCMYLKGSVSRDSQYVFIKYLFPYAGLIFVNAIFSWTFRDTYRHLVRYRALMNFYHHIYSFSLVPCCTEATRNELRSVLVDKMWVYTAIKKVAAISYYTVRGHKACFYSNIPE